MDKAELKRLIDTAAGRVAPDLAIRGCKVVDVYSGIVSEGDIAVCEGIIAGVGSYRGNEEIDGTGLYAAPGFIDGLFMLPSEKYPSLLKNLLRMPLSSFRPSLS